MNYWLMKSEPAVFSIDDLQINTEKYAKEIWDGVRNYQARNYLKQMQQHDWAFFYHSNCKVPGIYGLMKIVEQNIVDPSQFDPQSKYFDRKSKPDNPRWHTVSVAFLQKYSSPVTLEQLKQQYPEQQYGKDFALIKRATRLSVMPVPKEIFNDICQSIIEISEPLS